VMLDHTEPSRRAMALVSPHLDGDDVAFRALRSADSPPLAHLWAVDPDGDV
jgi:hypothetical protein